MEYPTKSAHIRALGLGKMATADIARSVGVSYQHARKVLIDADLLNPKVKIAVSLATPKINLKPRLNPQTLLEAGFRKAGVWRVDQEVLTFDGKLPTTAGVYAFCDDEEVFYAGVSTRNLEVRLYGYQKPGTKQQTNIRVKAALLSISVAKEIQVLIATPGSSTWNGLPVNLSAGLELGLIRTYNLTWNKLDL